MIPGESSYHLFCILLILLLIGIIWKLIYKAMGTKKHPLPLLLWTSRTQLKHNYLSSAISNLQQQRDTDRRSIVRLRAATFSYENFCKGHKENKGDTSGPGFDELKGSVFLKYLIWIFRWFSKYTYFHQGVTDLRVKMHLQCLETSLEK